MIDNTTLSRLARAACAALAAAAAAGSLTACFPLVVGGAVATGLIATDRRTSGAQLEDQGIELRASNRLRETLGERAHINVTSFNRQVLLTGEVSAAQDRQTAEQTVARVENVRSIVNELVVAAPSSLGDRSNDTLISGKVKASFVDAKDLFSNAFKVVTERGVVYLMGRVTEREAKRATEIARGVSGVVKVVRIFEIISEEELQRLSTQAPASSGNAQRSEP
ncbi:BON domain-containing protein [Ramlibacter sp. H39-3-26]|uniref:BON domain-containing protein n=1 Tax=Curvibacter soli TaxID=3031331 RepID=UPI0023D9C292|nr:BON domain-containing protein [Ramlibacter sp. H39-3-26]MDF1485842.1 BON domain-containing protein [Ramlibacter sp. H39-3-26]